MFKKMSIPVSHSLIQRGKTYLLLHNAYKECLLQQGIEEVEAFLKKSIHDIHYLEGRTPHPSIPLGDGKRMVLRQYSHGGLLRALTGDLYLIGSRSFRELAITEEIRSCGIPTIQAIGAIHQSVCSLFYRAYFLSLEIPRAKNLPQYFQKKGSPSSIERLLHKRKMIRTAGALLGQFHRAGFYHNDLQLKNLLVDGDRILLIDFDRSFRKKTLSVRNRIKNLLRLNRSVDKWKRSGLSTTRTDRLRFLLAYAGEEQEILRSIRRSLWTYTLSLFFHRIGWAIKDLVRS
jgi:tRNA A-37 threonylcarbamoyl transferase component Bud32